MTTTRRLRVAAVLAVLAMVAVAACQEPETSTGAEPTSEVTTEVTTEPTTGPSSEQLTPPVSDVEMPQANDLMTEDSTDGAAAAAWYFLKVWNYARATGDVDVYNSLYEDSCNWCGEQGDAIAAVYSAGGWLTDGEVTFDIATALIEFPSEQNPFYTVRLDVTIDAYVVQSPDGPVLEEEATVLSPMAIAVRYQGDGFVVTAVNYAVA